VKEQSARLEHPASAVIITTTSVFRSGAPAEPKTAK